MTLIERINVYLQSGGLFNPEMANHDAVRDLLMDCRRALAEPAEDAESVQQEYFKRGFQAGFREGVEAAAQEVGSWPLCGDREMGHIRALSQHAATGEGAP